MSFKFWIASTKIKIKNRNMKSAFTMTQQKIKLIDIHLCRAYSISSYKFDPNPIYMCINR